MARRRLVKTKSCKNISKRIVQMQLNHGTYFSLHFIPKTEVFGTEFLFLYGAFLKWEQAKDTIGICSRPANV